LPLAGDALREWLPRASNRNPEPATNGQFKRTGIAHECRSWQTLKLSPGELGCPPIRKQGLRIGVLKVMLGDACLIHCKGARELRPQESGNG